MAGKPSKQTTFGGWDIKPEDAQVELLSAVGNITYQMKPYEQVVRVTTIASYAMKVTLPPVSQCVGRLYYIIHEVRVDQSCVVEDFKADAGLSDITFDAAGEYVVLFSTGEVWLEVVTGYS